MTYHFGECSYKLSTEIRPWRTIWVNAHTDSQRREIQRRSNACYQYPLHTHALRRRERLNVGRVIALNTPCRRQQRGDHGGDEIPRGFLLDHLQAPDRDAAVGHRACLAAGAYTLPLSAVTWDFFGAYWVVSVTKPDQVEPDCGRVIKSAEDERTSDGSMTKSAQVEPHWGCSVTKKAQVEPNWGGLVT
jgi:hypothetical protein